MTFRVRTALVVLALTAVTMGGAFTIVWERFVASQRAQLDKALLDVGRREAVEAAAGHLEFSDAPGPSANAVGPLPKYGVIYGINGMPLSHTENFASVPPMPHVQAPDVGFDFEHDGIRMRGVLVLVEHTGRRVLLATPREDLEDDARILARAMLIAFAVGCAWAAAVAIGVATRLTRQHRIIENVARRVAEGDTSARVEFASSDVDIVQLANDLNAMIERLVGLLGAQDRFVSHAAHELRTPLTSLRIELEHALRPGADPTDHEAALGGALDSARRLTRLADDLLQLARVDAAPSKDLTSLEDAVTDAVADVAPVARSRELHIDVTPIATMVRGERRSVGRILRNVIENAVRFSPRGGSVRIAAVPLEGKVEISVVDEGPGIPDNDLPRIFEPFARGANNDAWESAGLGLSIARGLARSLGGDVTAASGAGARFVITLPTRLEREDFAVSVGGRFLRM
ncbi:periplasmic sensor signal transduction histidine kinase [Labilithrix luteola]|uniref:histidine kinase n=1 Tax=Labilithrix luteola TaxID=1391654 RepID=A0A0K1PYV3_9BACT|nr:HAMP domain-containing sensor histidine kinase [Labilithrix luteola]AKU98677.1 periplasmic sensor signal transduction histidine kinase [Labilithrix luteola]